MRLSRKAAVFVLMAASAWAPRAQAQTFHLLYTFTNAAADGANPFGTPLLYQGKLYGTASAGGAFSAGTVFSLALESRQLTVLHSFTGTDGASPNAGLIVDPAGNFYGTTTGYPTPFLGTVFQMSSTGAVTVLHSFTGPDGSEPYYGKLVRDSAGNLYGTTLGGGAGGTGTVFKLDTSGNLTTLHSFGNTTGDPYDGLLVENGVFYTACDGDFIPGNSNLGTLFALNPATSQAANIYRFTGNGSGALPLGGLTGDGQGNLYGTASYSSTNFSGNGVVFGFNLASRQYTVLHAFAGGPADGAFPGSAMVMDSQGKLYGTTIEGGTYGSGTVFEMDTAGNLTILYSFDGANTGSHPSGLTMDSQGNLYGVTAYGGNNSSGYGTVFVITP